MSRRMKPSGIPVFNNIPCHWKLIRNKYIFTKRNSKVGVEFSKYQLLSLTTQGVQRRDINAPGGKQPASFSTYQGVKKNDLILCLFDLDVSAVFSGLSKYDGMITSAYDVFFVNHRGYNRYYGYMFQLIGFDRSYIPYSKSLRNTINADSMGKIYSLLPPLKEQVEIVNFLDLKINRIKYIISETKVSIEELKKYKQSIITEVVTKGLDSNVEMKESGIEWIEKIPDKWSQIRIKYILVEKSDKTTTGEEEPLSMSQIHGIIPSKDMEVIPNPSANNIGKRIVKKSDLVFNKLKAHLGVFDVSKYDGIVSPDYAVYQVRDLHNADYLEYLFKTSLMIAEFIKHSRGVGSGLTRLYTSEFFNIKIPLPSYKEQNKIVSYLNGEFKKIDTLITNKEKVIEELEQYKKSLIYEYVTGEKEV